MQPPCVSGDSESSVTGTASLPANREQLRLCFLRRRDGSRGKRKLARPPSPTAESEECSGWGGTSQIPGRKIWRSMEIAPASPRQARKEGADSSVELAGTLASHRRIHGGAAHGGADVGDRDRSALQCLRGLRPTILSRAARWRSASPSVPAPKPHTPKSLRWRARDWSTRLVVMKLCPNPICPHRLRRGAPAEFLDRATVCNDCGIALVDERAFGTSETAQAVSAWHGERERLAASDTKADTSAPRRLDIVTGVALIALSAVLLVGSYMAAVSMGGGSYVIAVGPFIYGMFRLVRGLDAKKTPS